MIAGTYILSGVLLAIRPSCSNGLAERDHADDRWGIIFFFASAGASPGYLTVSEIFPLEVRAKRSRCSSRSRSASARSGRSSAR